MQRCIENEVTCVRYWYDLDSTSGVRASLFRERSISSRYRVTTLFLGYDMFHLILLFFISCYLASAPKAHKFFM